MRSLKILPAALALSVIPLAATAQQLISPSEVLDKIVAQEQAEVQLLRQGTLPLVETYIQYVLGPDKQVGTVPDGDKYFIGRAGLARGVELDTAGAFRWSEAQVAGRLARVLLIGVCPARLPAGWHLPGYVRLRPRAFTSLRMCVASFWVKFVWSLSLDVDPLPRDQVRGVSSAASGWRIRITT